MAKKNWRDRQKKMWNEKSRQLEFSKRCMQIAVDDSRNSFNFVFDCNDQIKLM